MQRASIRFFSVLALLGTLAAAPPVSEAQIRVYDPNSVRAAGYVPVYYINHLVFFDAEGRPYYYDNEDAFYVPPTYSNYNFLLNHYRRYQPQYLAWYQALGHRLLSYRRPAATSYYTPEYYEGSVVYYDAHGRPMYYVDGTRYFVPVGSPYYHRYVQHWRRHRPHYDRWYRDHGRSYMYYRRAPRVDYYTPMTYQGYVVYYDDTGRPFYYMGGRQSWVPNTSPYYSRYRTHWQTNRTHYTRWHREHGTSYRSYRRPTHARERTTRRVPQDRFRPGHHRPAARQPAGRHPGARQPAGHHPGARQPAGHHPGARQPAGHHPGARQPAGHHPGARQPVGRGPGAREPVGRGPGAREPVGRGPGAREPAGRGPGAREPAGRGPGAREPAGRGPGARQPAGRGPGAREPAGRGPGAREPAGRGPGARPPAMQQPERRPRGGPPPGRQPQGMSAKDGRQGRGR